MLERRLPGFDRMIAQVGVALSGLGTIGAGAEPLPHLWTGLVRRARAGGATVFDLTEGAGEQRLVHALSEALPLSDPHLFLIDSVRPPPGRAARWEDLDTLRQSHGAILGRPVDLLLLPTGRHAAEIAQLGESAIREGISNRWGLELDPEPTVDLAPVLALGVGAVSLPLNLLQGDLWDSTLEACADHGTAVFVRDPFAAGRLDGSLIRQGPFDQGPGPLRVRELRSQLTLVLGLEFLTKDRQRTLAQAAIQFALTFPAVASVLVSAGGPRELDDALAAPTRPALTVDQLVAIRARTAAPRAPSYGAGSSTSP
jgi:Aldo/keto reductase family